MMPHIESIALYTYQYELCLHLLGCVVIIALALATGVKPARTKGHGSRLAIIMGMIFVFIQIPITLLRMNAAFEEGFTLADPMSLYINFFWSPMCTVFLLWLYLSHLVSSCKQCNMAVPKANLRPMPRWDRMLWCIAAGIGTSYIIHEYVAAQLALDDMWLLRFMLGVALAGAPLEIIYFRARKNEVRFFNYTWAWFVGTWLFFIPKV